MLSVTAFPATMSDANTPYQARLYGDLRRRGVTVRSYNRLIPTPGSSDLLHVHWPDRVFGGLARLHPSIGRWQAERLLATARAFVAKGRPVVWTVHNQAPHDFRSESFRDAYPGFEAAFLELVTATVHLTTAGMAAALAAKPAIAGKQAVVIPHMAITPASTGAERTRPAELERWRKTGRCFAALGQIRRYKRLEAVIASFRTHAKAGETLIIAGAPSDEAYVEELSAACAGRDDILLAPRGLPTAEFDWILSEADVLFAMNAGSGNSGVLMAALSAGRPVVTVAGDMSAEFVARLPAGWVIELASETDWPSDAALDAPRDPVDLSWASPEAVGAAHLAFFQSLLNRG